MRLRGSPGYQGSWPLRTIRGGRLDRNPLRRGIDRLETCLLVGLFVVLAAVTPFTAGLAAHASYLSALHTRQEQLATRHPVQAMLTGEAGTDDGYSLNSYVLTQATWTSSNGVRHIGEVPASPGSPKGTAITVWTSASGELESPPLAIAEVVSQADASATAAVVGAGVFYIAAAAAIRLLLNRRRMAAWDADWVTTAQAWNRQSW